PRSSKQPWLLLHSCTSPYSRLFLLVLLSFPSLHFFPLLILFVLSTSSDPSSQSFLPSPTLAASMQR
ncbi:hypothetical protein PFISCL1PPCAC_11147, partial [Pristionchus fissidentatus]